MCDSMQVKSCGVDPRCTMLLRQYLYILTTFDISLNGIPLCLTFWLFLSYYKIFVFYCILRCIIKTIHPPPHQHPASIWLCRCLVLKVLKFEAWMMLFGSICLQLCENSCSIERIKTNSCILFTILGVFIKIYIS